MILIMKKLKQNSGMGLVEVLTVVGIMSIISLSMTSLLGNFFKASKAAEQKQSQNEIHQDIYNLLSSIPNCTATFGSKILVKKAAIGDDILAGSTAGAPNLLTALKRSVPPPGPDVTEFEDFAVGGATYKNKQIKITKMVLKDLQPVLSNTGAFTNQSTATLSIDYSKVQSTVGSDQYASRTFKIQFWMNNLYDGTTGVERTVVRCTAVGGIGDQIWIKEASGEIHYDGFNVGVNIADPNFQFHVFGANATVAVERAANPPEYLLRQFNGSAGAPTATAANNVIGQITAQGNSATTFSYVPGAQIAFVAAENFTSTAAGTNMLFGTSNTGTAAVSEKMRIAANGNVGIGTTNPGVKLQVSGAHGDPATITNGSMYLTGGGTAAASLLMGNDNTTAGSEYAWIQSHGSRPFYINRAGNNTILNFSAGNVGVGTASPGSRLSSAGGLSVGSGYAATASPANGAIIEGAVGIGTSAPAAGNSLQVMNGGLSVGYAAVAPNPGAIIRGGVAINDSAVTGGYNLDVNGDALVRGNLRVNGGISSPVFTITSAGDLTIAGRLWVKGDASIGPTQAAAPGTTSTYINGGNISTTTVSAPSDIRLKKDILNIDLSLERILRLRPVQYHWKDQKADKRMQFGLIAQELEDVIPELVQTNKPSGYKAVNYMGLTAFTIGAIQELAAENAKLKAENAEIKARLEKIEAALEKH